MALSSCLLIFLGFISIAEIAFSICVPPNHCIEDMDDLIAQQQYDYVVEKYEAAKIKIHGKPVGLHGKMVTHGLKVEQHLVFHYVDNTLHDIIQTCTFVLSQAPDQCEGISTFCSGFLRNPPRRLLELEPLMVCEDSVRVGSVESKTEPETGPKTTPETATEAGPEAEAEAEAVPKGEPNIEAPVEAYPQKAADNNTAPTSKFRMFKGTSP